MVWPCGRQVVRWSLLLWSLFVLCVTVVVVVSAVWSLLCGRSMESALCRGRVLLFVVVVGAWLCCFAVVVVLVEVIVAVGVAAVSVGRCKSLCCNVLVCCCCVC